MAGTPRSRPRLRFDLEPVHAWPDIGIVERRPYFRFSPRAYERGDIVEDSRSTCTICKRPARWRYDGTIYSVEEIEGVCATCIALGNVAIVSESYSLHDAELHPSDLPLPDEIAQRTPGFSTFNPFVWPDENDIPYAFLGASDEAPAASWFAASTKENSRWPEYATYEEMLEGPYTLIFRSLDGERYAFEHDFD